MRLRRCVIKASEEWEAQSSPDLSLTNRPADFTIRQFLDSRESFDEVLIHYGDLYGLDPVGLEQLFAKLQGISTVRWFTTSEHGGVREEARFGRIFSIETWSEISQPGEKPARLGGSGTDSHSPTQLEPWIGDKRSLVRVFSAGPGSEIGAAWYQTVSRTVRMPDVSGNADVDSTSPTHVRSTLEEIPADDLKDTIAFLDLTIGWHEWSLDLDSERRSLIALMVLFPEVYWVFVVPDQQVALHGIGTLDGWQREQFIACHVLEVRDLGKQRLILLRHAQGFRSMMDPFGVRRSLIGCELNGHGVSIEDEPTYRELNGYLLYVRKLAVFLVGNGAELQAVGELIRMNPERQWFVVEDIDLRFTGSTRVELERLALAPERDEDLHQMLRRREHAHSLDKAAARIILSGVRYDPGILFHGSELHNCHFASKPYEGIYDARIERWLPSALRSPHEPRLRGSRARGNTMESQEKGKQLGDKANRGRATWEHSPAGRKQALAIAALERRARLRVNSGGGPTEALVMAILAGAAADLLAGSPVHLAAEAEVSRQVSEADAESAWTGVTMTASRATMSLRYDYLSSTVKRMFPDGRVQVQGQRHQRQLANIMLYACGELRAVYDRFHRKDEADFFVRRYRSWLRQYWLSVESEWSGRRGVWVRIVHWAARLKRGVGGLLLAYINFIVSGWRALALSSGVVMVCFALLFWLMLGGVAIESKNAVDYGFGTSLVHSATVFSGLQGSLEGGLGAEELIQEGNGAGSWLGWGARTLWLLSTVEVFLGLFHMGALVVLFLEKFRRR